MKTAVTSPELLGLFTVPEGMPVEYAVVEMMGHTSYGARISEVDFIGAKHLHCEVFTPRLLRERYPDAPRFCAVQRVPAATIFRVTVCTEDDAKLYNDDAEFERSLPGVKVWTGPRNAEDEDEEDDETDDTAEGPIGVPSSRGKLVELSQEVADVLRAVRDDGLSDDDDASYNGREEPLDAIIDQLDTLAHSESALLGTAQGCADPDAPGHREEEEHRAFESWLSHLAKRLRRPAPSVISVEHRASVEKAMVEAALDIEAAQRVVTPFDARRAGPPPDSTKDGQDMLLKLACLASRPGRVFRCTYRNHEGKTERRTIRFDAIQYGSNDYHPVAQFLARVYCLDRKAVRHFAVADMNGLELLNKDYEHSEG